ncbi:Long chain acyl-CoA synthetase 7, peroxisomal [Tritrichomonas foetus]|uniref:Long chain acyl-CoA synthetase 7, peroxisomal n=1 Tax=Tritrichomonas foetus TaxID=1144522 RepID=A0A1J4JV11_9EUKA|nr:Long chain acyl-CoA synthetase 7, peroxisomal [Tritrichomonas foetus]|eukprot:OHT01366.1 Long chain acyl-CoA synthetase 7, peroxisomal [Tritrichomonas foetus]
MGSDASCIISGENQFPDETPLLNSPLMNKYDSNRLMSRFPDLPNVGTIEDLYLYTKSIAPDDDFYGYRDFRNGKWQNSFTFISRNQFSEMRNSVGSYIVSLGIKNDEHIGILSFSRLEWVVAQYACYAYGLIPVPIYDTYGWAAMNYIIKHANLRVSFVISTKVNELIHNLDDDSPLSDIIIIDVEDSPYDYDHIPKTSIKLHNYSEILKYDNIYPHHPPQPSTPAFIMYTSGTTGNPKGCIVTHANFISTAASIYTYAYPFSRDDKMLSYLPLAHVYEGVQHVVAMKVIGRVAFYSGNIKRLMEELNLFKPTIICGVTRVFERIYTAMNEKLQTKSFAARAAVHSIFGVKSFLLKNFRVKSFPGVDFLLKPFRDALGGNVRLFVSGGSALPPKVQQFIRIATNASFLQGYGLTESTSSCCVQRSTDVLNGNCGALLPWCEAKMRTVDHYNSTDMCGELLVRGPSIFAGYYKDDESTKNAFTPDGFFKTGDIFQLNKTGQLEMIGRCKEHIKLSQGEYVSLQKLYDIYSTTEKVKQIYIHAGMHSRFLTAIVVTEPGVDKNTILRNLDNKANDNNLLGFEKIKNVFITNNEFTTDNGMMTPSLKLSGHAIRQFYQNEIQVMESSI